MFHFILFTLAFSTGLFATALSDAAALMKARTFRPVNTTGMNQETFYSDYIGVSGAKCNEPIFAFSQNAHWDPTSEEMLYMGSPHRGAWKFPIYSAKTNSWRLNPLPPAVAPLDFCTHHSYDKMALDTDRRQYYGEWGCWDGDTGTWLYRYDLDSAKWSKVNDKNRGVTGMGGHPAMEYFPEMGGIVMVGEAGGIISLLDPATDTWRVLPGRGAGDMHHILEYNPVHKIMLLGGGNGNQRLFILDTTGNVHALKTPPVHVGVADNGGVMTCDPVSGMFLYFMDKALWEFDPINDVWDSVCTYPLGISLLGRSAVVSIPSLGVVAVLSCNPWPLLLYKHAEPVAAEAHALRLSAPALSCSPNPFNAATRVGVHLPGAGRTEIAVFDLTGRAVASLFSGNLKAGGHSFLWDASRQAPGVYLLRMETAGRRISKRVILSE